jgi:sterol desaturase/sphingolipid hydroxylase (fatty acid hydroxylase superfamily)
MALVLKSKVGMPKIQYLSRHHSWHHSPQGSETAFGLTSGFWDIAFGTRVPAPIRARLYRRRSG